MLTVLRLVAAAAIAACLYIGLTISAQADNGPSPPVVSSDEGGGTVDTNLDWPGSSNRNKPSGRRGGEAAGATGGGGSVFCRAVGIGGNPEEEKRLDVNCGDTAGAGGPVISTAALAQQVANRLPIPKPDLEIRPYTRFTDGTRGGLAGAPVWLWIGDRTWKTLSQRTTLGPIWVNVVAKPTRTTWRFGDGKGITCRGKGTKLSNPAQGLRGSPDCGYTYRGTSAGQRKKAFEIRGTVTWTIEWTGSGNTGGILEPLELTSTIPYTVKQARARLVDPAGHS